jgi:hypothetical protein
MNKSYRLVWSSVRSAWTVVSELAKAHVKSGAAVVLISAASMTAQAQKLYVTGGAEEEVGGSGSSVVSATGTDYAMYVFGSTTTGNPSTILFLNPTTISISSESSAAIRADNGIIKEKDDAANGNYTINATKEYATGATIEAYNGSIIDLRAAANIAITSYQSKVILADNSSITLSNVVLNRRLAAAEEMIAENGGKLQINQLTYSDSASSAKTIARASGSGSSIQLGNPDTPTAIKVRDLTAPGVAVVLAENGGLVRLINTSVTTNNTDGIGVKVTDDSVAWLEGGSVAAYGTNSDGIAFSESSGINNHDRINVQLNNAVVTSDAANALGLLTWWVAA